MYNNIHHNYSNKGKVIKVCESYVPILEWYINSIPKQSIDIISM